MSGAIDHNIAEIIQQLLVDLTLGTQPPDDGSWPIYVSSGADTPDDIMVVSGYGGTIQGRRQVDGVACEQYTFQIKLRSEDQSGEVKLRDVGNNLDTSVQNTTVTLGVTNYKVHAITKLSSLDFLGPELGEQHRVEYTQNFSATITKL